MKIVHVVNPYLSPASCFHTRAQPITYASMVAAAKTCSHEVEVELVAVLAPEHSELDLPSDFHTTANLTRFSTDLYPDVKAKKLPTFSEIMELGMREISDGDFYIYTNVDICVQPSFYEEVAKLAEDHRAFTITRRNNLPVKRQGRVVTPSDLPWLYQVRGSRHPGFDCFVIHRDLLLGLCEWIPNALIGVPAFGVAVVQYLSHHEPTWAIFRNLFLTFHLGDDLYWKGNRMIGINKAYCDRRIRELKKFTPSEPTS